MTSYLSKIRGIPVIGDEVIKIIDSRTGLVDEPKSECDLLVCTESTLLIFRNGSPKTVEVLQKSSINKIELVEHRKNIPIFTMLSFMICSVIVYLGISYWLVESMEQPFLPGMNLALFPFALLVALSIGLWWVWKAYSFKDKMFIRLASVGGSTSQFNCSYDCRGDLLSNIIYFQSGVNV